jgi:opacity protein-like surface antigen
MRRLLIAMALASGVLVLPSVAHAQNSQIAGFGGMTFGDVTNSTTFGGNLAVPLTDNLQVIAEGGRMTNVLPSLADILIDLTPFDVAVSAWYGEAGVRFIGSSHQKLRPYAEATAGFARLSTGVSGLGSTASAITDAALTFFDRTDPLLGLGGGVMVQGGPLLVDLGYRYKKILASHSVQGVLTGGDFSVNEVRIGFGVRF